MNEEAEFWRCAALQYERSIGEALFHLKGDRPLHAAEVLKDRKMIEAALIRADAGQDLIERAKSLAENISPDYLGRKWLECVSPFGYGDPEYSAKLLVLEGSPLRSFILYKPANAGFGTGPDEAVILSMTFEVVGRVGRQVLSPQSTGLKVWSARRKA